MRALLKLSFLLLLLSLVALLAATWFALSDQPLVTGQVELSHQDIARAKAILRENDPRQAPAGAQRVIEISAQEMNLAANYLLQKTLQGHARLGLAAGRLDVGMTLLIPQLPRRNYLNVEAVIEARANRPELTALRLGRLRVPGPLAGWLARQLLEANLGRARLASAASLIESLEVFPDRLRLTYRWNPALIAHARDTLLADSDREALRFYYQGLLSLQSRDIGRSGAVVELLAQLFAMAVERSRERDPVAENVALLTVLGAWASRQDIARLLPDRTGTLRAFRLKLDGRRDFAQHFLTSAALAARGDSSLSNAVGLFKEISDTDQGSGFSFADIAADRAGTRFGALATRSAADARRVQRRLAAGIVDADIMPPAKDLPEQMHTDAFRQRFSHVGSPAYQQLMAEIEQRIDTCALYRD